MSTKPPRCPLCRKRMEVDHYLTDDEKRSPRYYVTHRCRRMGARGTEWDFDFTGAAGRTEETAIRMARRVLRT
jgi:hypothetical protein